MVGEEQTALVAFSFEFVASAAKLGFDFGQTHPCGLFQLGRAAGGIVLELSALHGQRGRGTVERFLHPRELFLAQAELLGQVLPGLFQLALEVIQRRFTLVQRPGGIRFLDHLGATPIPEDAVAFEFLGGGGQLGPLAQQFVAFPLQRCGLCDNVGSVGQRRRDRRAIGGAVRGLRRLATGRVLRRRQGQFGMQMNRRILNREIDRTDGESVAVFQQHRPAAAELPTVDEQRESRLDMRQLEFGAAAFRRHHRHQRRHGRFRQNDVAAGAADGQACVVQGIALGPARTEPDLQGRHQRRMRRLVGPKGHVGQQMQARTEVGRRHGDGGIRAGIGLAPRIGTVPRDLDKPDRRNFP